MVHFDGSKGKRATSMGDRMTDYLLAMRRERDRKRQQKIDAGYRPRLDAKGNVVLVDVGRDPSSKGGQHGRDQGDG